MAKKPGNGGQQSQGPATDSHNDPVVDPTANVFALVASETRRQDDLRNMANTHLHEIMELRGHFYEELRMAESERINAIRAVDVQAVQRAAEVSATQATTLAGQVASSAEALRAQVAATETKSQIALAAALDPIQKDVADLRRVQYEQQGQRSQQVETKGDRGVNMGYLFGAVGALVGVAGIILALVRI